MNVVLKRFMIFNSSEGQDEGHERDKLLYHWTKEAGHYGQVELAEQIDDVCLCDASITASIRLSSGLGHNNAGKPLTESYNSSHAASEDTNSTSRHLVLTFQSTVIVIVEVESESSIWMAAHVSQSQMDGIGTPTVTHQDSDNIPSDAVIRIIKNIYEHFCMINGTFQMMRIDYTDTTFGEETNDDVNERCRSTIRDRIRSTCESYFNNILQEIHLGSVISNVASLCNYLVYLELNPLTLMKVTSFINHLVCIDPNQIRHTIAIFNDQLLWTSLNMYDSRLVYNYMIGVLIRNALQEELTQEVEKVRRIAVNMIIYLTDDSELFSESSISAADTVEGKRDIRQNRKLTRFYLTVFRSSNNMTLGLFFKDHNQFDLIQKCEQILTSDTRLGVVPLASLAKSVGQNFLKTNYLAKTSQISQTTPLPAGRRSSAFKGATPFDLKYVCLDRLEASVSSSFSLDTQSRGRRSPSEGPELPKGSRKSRLIQYLAELEPEMQNLKNLTGRRVDEYFVKTTSDTWLTMMSSKYRCIYSVYKMRNAGLIEAQQAAVSLKQTLMSRRS